MDRAALLEPNFSPLLVRYGDLLLELGRRGEAETGHPEGAEG